MVMKDKNIIATELTNPAIKICLESSPVGIIIFDCNAKVRYTNQLAEQLFKRDAAEITDPKCGDFIGCSNRDLDPKGCGNTTNCPGCPLLRAIKSICDSNNLKHTQEGEAYLERDAGSSNIWVKFKANHIVADGQRAVIMAFDDITSHKRNEEQLNNALAELAAIHENASMTMILLDSDQRVRKVNGCAVNFADRTAVEMIGLPGGVALRCLHHLDHPNGCGFGPVCGDCKIQAAVLATFKEQTNQAPIEAWFPFDSNNLRDDRCLLINSSYLQINDAAHVLLCIQDITAQKQFEEHLKIYQKIVTSIPDRIAFVDKDYRYKIVNEDCDSLSGINSKSVIGMQVAENLGQEVFQHIIKPNSDRCLDGEIVNFQEWFTCPIKGKRFFDVSYYPYTNSHGKITGIVSYSRDITNRKRAEEALRMSEERFRRLFTQNSATMLIIDPNTGNIIEANKAAANFYGWSIEELRQMSIQEINTLSPAAVKDLMKKARSSGSLTFEFCHRRADGSIRDVEVFSSRIDIEEKDFLYSIIHDITERKQIEKALQLSLAEKEVLLREVHHRVKNNLAAIIGLFNLQLRAIDDPEVQTVLTELSSRVLSMSLVHEKLYRSHSLARIDFQDYLQSLISHLRTSYGSPDICCEIVSKGIEMPLDLAVPCGMIINELITNALKYAFPKEQSGSADKNDRILVTITRDMDIFSLSVADNGIGLPSGFDFDTVKTLGLVLVRMLGRHQLAGRYEIDQTDGTRFTLTFSRNGRIIHE